MGVPWVDPCKPIPEWITRTLAKPCATYNQRRTALYYQRLHRSTLVWACRADIAEIYARAERMRKNGLDVQVDHIIPINGDDVCGLHVADNLEIIHRLANQKKSNRIYPGSPCEQMTIPDTEQLTLF